MSVTDHQVVLHRVEVDEVLVPVDFSPLSWQVLPLARHVADRFGAPVTPVHVDTASPWREGERSAPLRLRAMPYGQRTEVLVTAEANAVDGVMREVAKRAHPLVAMSSHGHSGIAELALGSVCEGVLRRLDGTALITGPRFDVARQADVRRIVVSVDVSAGNDAILGEALSWARALDVPLQVVTVLPHHDVEAEQVSDEAIRFSKIVDSVAALDDRVSGLLLEGARPGHELARYAAAMPGTLLAMSTHARAPLTRSLVGSTVMAVIRHAVTGVLVRRQA